MKRILLIIIFIFLITITTISAYDFQVAGISVIGASAGAYSGQLLSVPLLILFSNAGIIEEDIYSPFSTAMYDAMDFGSEIGAVVGGVTAKYTYLELTGEMWGFKNIVFDVFTSFIVVILSHITLDVIENFIDIPPFVENIIITPILSGTYLGFPIPID